MESFEQFDNQMKSIISKRGGLRPGAGRKKGSVNVLTRTIREAIKEAFTVVGGTKWLVELAESDPRCFAGLLAKAMPPELEGTMAFLCSDSMVDRMARARKRAAETEDRPAVQVSTGVPGGFGVAPLQGMLPGLPAFEPDPDDEPPPKVAPPVRRVIPEPPEVLLPGQASQRRTVPSVFSLPENQGPLRCITQEDW